MSDYRLGVKSHLYYSADSTLASTNYVDIVELTDLNMDNDAVLDSGMVLGSPIMQSDVCGFDITITGTLLRKDTAIFTYLEDLYNTGASCPFMCLDGAKDSNGARGVRAHMHITSWKRTQGPNARVAVNFTLKPIKGITDPVERVLVSAGAPVGTDYAL